MADMLDAETIKELNKIFANLKGNVKIVYHGDSKAQLDGPIRQLLGEVEKLSGKISLEIKEEHTPITPYFDLFGKNKGTIRFMGIPSGHEFTTLVNSILMASDGRHELKKESIEFLESLGKPLDLKVFITPTCPYCPQAVFMAHRFAMVSDKVTASMVEAMEFPELSQKFSISSVPNTIVNDKEGFVGATPEDKAIESIKKLM